MNNESSSKFISALVKALQTLCHGYIEFNDGIEIIGHIYLNIDSGSSFDYVVKEKLCKSTENSTVFVSKSFQAQAPLDECLTRKDKNDHATEFDDAPDMSPTTGTTRIASAITSISNVLSGAQDSQRSRLLDHSSLHPLPQNTGKRKREHNGSYGSLQPPVKYTTLQASSSSSSPYFSSEPSSKLPADRNHSEHFHASAHGEFFGADSNPSSGMGADEEDDLHLDVTFVKEEYQRNSSHRGAPASAASRLNQDLPSNHSHLLHDGTSGVGALGYSSGHHQGSHFASGTAGDIGSINDSFHDTSQVDIGHNAAQGPPNPRSDPGGVQDMDASSPASSSLKLEDMVGISDTLQLGIKFFGSEFIADVASGNIALPPAALDLISENGPEVKSEHAIVFPDMFDLTAVSDVSLKPDHKILWHDRKDKLRKTYMTKKANLTQFCSRILSKKTVDFGNALHQAINDCPKKGLRREGVLCDASDVPYRRKRGRPPKRLKMFSSLDDIPLGKGATEMDKEVDQNFPTKGNYTESTNACGVHIFPRCIASVRSLFASNYSKRIRGSYKQYTAADKLEIIEFGLKHGSTAASRKYNIPESTVRSWTKKMDTFLMQMKLCENTPQVEVLGVPFDKKNPSASCADLKENTQSPLTDSLDSSLLIKLESLL